MNRIQPLRRLVPLLVLAFIGSAVAGPTDSTRPIRLRNELIQVQTGEASTPKTPAGKLDGLFLVQCAGPIVSEWRDRLNASGAQVLHYVPEDTLLVRANGMEGAGLAALPFVNWVGSYRPDHKVHAGLRAAFVRAAPGQRIAVKLVVSPVATAIERAFLRRWLTPVASEVRWSFGFTMEGWVTAPMLGEVARSPAVLWIELAPRIRMFDEVSSKLVAGDDGEFGTRAVSHQLGFDGRGVTVAVADSGLHNGDAASMHPDLAGRVDAFFHYGTLRSAADEHSHGTHVAGIVAGDGATGETDEYGSLYGLGVAPGAHLVAQRIFDGVGNYEAPPSFAALTRDARGAGAVIGSNSWGDDTQGRYDISAAEFDALVRDADLVTPLAQPYILEFSAGNAGPGDQTVGSPAVAKNVIATGASQNNRFDFFIYAEGQDTMADFSSRGPCEDGRIKPDVVAPGTWIASLQSESATDENAWAGISSSYLYQGGTSQAGPHVSGAAAVFVQHYRERVTNALPSPALVKAALIDAAVDMEEYGGTATIPNGDEGWGRVDLTELIGAARRSEYVDQAVLLRTGEVHERRLIVFSGEEPLRVTLAYTDPAALPASIPALVNDLDLEMVGPDGSVYRGNQFEAGESVPGASAFNRVDNVEAIRIASPAPGEYTVRVLAHRVVEDARTETVGVEQDFALVLSGDLPLPGVGTLVLDRGAYRAPDTMRLKLIDFDLAGNASAAVTVTSDTERKGEVIDLSAIGTSGVFTGSVAVVEGTGTADGILQVKEGSVITVTYDDASPAAARTVTARADFRAPILSGVAVTNRFGRMVVTWTSDEPATSVVRWGTNATPNLAITNRVRVQDHAVALEGLEAGLIYRFSVGSADEAGNATTDDRGGLYYTFVAVPAATVLLVDAYEHGPDDDSIDIPVTEYTDALDGTGASYEVWNVLERGSPSAAELRPYRVVVWRINDSFYDSTTLTSGQQTAIRTYLDGGGAFLMASMEILSRLGDGPFRRDVLKVTEFTLNPSPFDPCDTCDEDHGVPTIIGEDSDPVGNGIVLDLDYALFPSFEFLGIGPDLGDTFRPATNAVPVLIELNSERACGVRFPRTGEDSAGRMVFFSFPLEAVPLTGTVPNNRVHLLRQALNFLAPGLSGFGSVALDRTSYGIPGRMLAEVADADLGGRGSLEVTFASDSVSKGVKVILQETARRGLFRGFATLIAVSTPTGPGLLRTKHGDRVWVEYVDESSGALVTAEAEVDTHAPLISGVVAEPLYEDATVRWETSEPADALVQFLEGGPSFPINRTAYDPDPLLSHELTLNGLRPDTVYHYQVVSRDEAGNVAVDSNGGNYYELRTLKPLMTPWADDFETAGTNWTVFDGDESQASWQLGVPANGMETEAHSPVNAWGSNIDGTPIDYADSFLISPALELSGGSRATLTFWHSYDFTERSAFDLLEVGQVMLITNIVGNPVVLAEFGDFSAGWDKVEIDLSPYMGRVVFIVFGYQLLSFDFEEVFERPGWLVDDVAIEISGKVSGTVRVTNNLAQARFTLSGPAVQGGAGLETTFTNLAPADYVVRWDPVPYYTTPTPQTNALVAYATLTFAGNYTFPDANGNGMSDLWEQQWFGTVDSGRLGTVDTDGDGADDRAEFLAGTDPTQAGSRLALALPNMQANGAVQLTWPTLAGRAYRVLNSPDLVRWTPLSDWLPAGGTTLSQMVPPPQAEARYFRVEVRP